MAIVNMLSLAIGLCLLICGSSCVDCQEVDAAEDQLTILPYNPCQVVRCGYGMVCRSFNGKAKCVPPSDEPQASSTTRKVIKPSECPSICPAIYKPVCGSDGQKYSNGCQMGVAACKLGKVIKEVPCESITTTTRRPCRAGCPKIMAPVCGSDGVTYANQCILEYAQCTGKDVEMCHKGRCEVPICSDELEY